HGDAAIEKRLSTPEVHLPEELSGNLRQERRAHQLVFDVEPNERLLSQLVQKRVGRLGDVASHERGRNRGRSAMRDHEQLANRVDERRRRAGGGEAGIVPASPLEHPLNLSRREPYGSRSHAEVADRTLESPGQRDLAVDLLERLQELLE